MRKTYMFLIIHKYITVHPIMWCNSTGESWLCGSNVYFNVVSMRYISVLGVIHALNLTVLRINLNSLTVMHCERIFV